MENENGWSSSENMKDKQAPVSVRSNMVQAKWQEQENRAKGKARRQLSAEEREQKGRNTTMARGPTEVVFADQWNS